MTVTYAPTVSKSRVFGLMKLLFRWTGSIWKLILGEFIVFMVLYYAIFLLNTFGLHGEDQSRFHGMILLFRDYERFVPMSLLLGFYINQVTTRWWGTWLSLPWIATWSGSIWKLVLGEFIVFIALYYAIFLLNRFGLHGDHERRFPWTDRDDAGLLTFRSDEPSPWFLHQSSNYSLVGNIHEHSVDCDVVGYGLPYVVGSWGLTVGAERSWVDVILLQAVSSPAVLISSYVTGSTERARLVRRTLVRYLCMQMVLALRGISPPVRKRFPTLHHLVEAGIMTKSELKELNSTTHDYGNYYIPTMWYTSLLKVAKREGFIENDLYFKILIDEAVKFRSSCAGLLGYDCINIPLIYTQVATLSVYFYFLCVFLRDKSFRIKTHTTASVGEVLINPLGGDDDDFDINSIIDLNFGAGALMVDRLHEKHPPMEKTKYWDMEKVELPYTKASQEYFTKPHLGSMFDFAVPQEDSEWVRVRDDKSGNDQKTSEETEWRVPQEDPQWARDDKLRNDGKIGEETEPAAKTETRTTTISLPDHI